MGLAATRPNLPIAYAGISKPSNMSKPTDSMTECWLRAADDLLWQAEPPEASYVLAMTCSKHACEHCAGRFPTSPVESIYRALYNESLAKESLTLRHWRQAVFSAAEAMECYYAAAAAHSSRKVDNDAAEWQQGAAARGLVRCKTLQGRARDEAAKADAAARSHDTRFDRKDACS